MNLNTLAKEVAYREGMKLELSIAQIKEVMRCLGDVLSEMDFGELADTLNRLARFKKPKRKRK